MLEGWKRQTSRIVEAQHFFFELFFIFSLERRRTGKSNDGNGRQCSKIDREFGLSTATSKGGAVKEAGGTRGAGRVETR